MLNKQEDGSAVLENIIVLPIVFLVIYIIIAMVFVTFDRAVLDTATQRGAIQARKMIEDPYYIEIVNNSVGSSSSDSSGYETITKVSDVGDVDIISIRTPDEGVQPYRYFFMKKSYIEEVAETKVKDYIDKLKLQIVKSDIEVEANVNNFIFYTSVEVISTRTYDLPFDALGFGLKDPVITSRSYTVVTDPDEFIRNVDLANEVLYDLGVTGKDGMLDQMFGKVKGMLERFFSKEEWLWDFLPIIKDQYPSY